MGLTFLESSMPQFLELDLQTVANSYSLRCDAKQGQKRFIDFDNYISDMPHFELGEFLPTPLIKGNQPIYIEDVDATGIPVINTLSIQNLKINIKDCRHITEEAFEFLDEDRKCKINDILLTVDGGSSIGKAVLFDLEGNYSIDSHVTILRPKNISPLVVVYLLASPMGQLQFQRAESGASGQTAVTEDDIRRFKFPLKDKVFLEKEVIKIDKARKEIERDKKMLEEKLTAAWIDFSNNLLMSEKVKETKTKRHQKTLND